MEKGFESWFQNQQFVPNPMGFQHRFSVPSLGNMLSPNTTIENRPMFTFAASKPQEPCSWFYGLTPVVNSIPKQLPEPPRATHEIAEKKFLVFDQSNDRTTLIYSSTPTQFNLPKPQLTFDIKKEKSVIEKHDDYRYPNPNLDYGNNVASEMHEDTEELKALLYSDDDDDEIDYYEDEEEQSTGHSPILMNGFDRHEKRNENSEQVASNTGCCKRRKLDSLEDTASSGVNCSGEGEFSSCGNDSSVGNVESGGKRARKEKVRETINILENLIPGGKNGKNAMVILDEAIDYLRVLKVKAKALGLVSL